MAQNETETQTAEERRRALLAAAPKTSRRVLDAWWVKRLRRNASA